MKINVKLLCQSTAEHLTQIYSGFNLLQKQDVIELKYLKDRNFQAGALAKPLVRAIIDNKFKVVYETFDGKNLFPEDLDWCDFYFKRSFSKEEVTEKGLANKVFPLGFNYSVYSNDDKILLRKLFWNLQKGVTKENLMPFLRSCSFSSYFINTSAGKFNSRVSSFESYPIIRTNPKILFITRLWEPSGRKDEKDRKEINKMRVESIRLLKKHFGDQFIGGLYPSPEASSQFRELILQRQEIRKASYLKQLRLSQICVTTRGLLGSNGWKLAEYIAGAKAIITEPLLYDVPGEFLPGKNYLEFTTPQGCIEEVQKLIDDTELRYSLMKNNYNYYHAYLRPDILVWNTLQLTLQKGQIINDNHR